MEHSEFPSDEMLAAFLDGSLDEETRKRVVAHVADCEDCYGTVEAAGAWRRENELHEAGTIPFPPRRNRRLIAFAAAAAVGGVLLYQPLTVQWHVHKLREAANEMPERAADERLSLDLSHKKFPRRRGLQEDTDDLTLLAAAGRVEADASKSSARQHSRGIALLVTGQREEAARVLGDAVMAQTGSHDLAAAINRCTDVALLNDLSAAHGAVADYGTKPASQAIALQAATRASELDPKSPVAAWNLAVAIQRVDPKAAVAAWNHYVAIDPSSSWGAEAKDRLTTLQEDR